MEKVSGKPKAWWQPAIVIFFKFSALIVFPLIGALYLGKWLDKKFGTAPWLFLACSGAAFVISIAGLVITVMRDYRKIEEDTLKSKIQSTKS